MHVLTVDGRKFQLSDAVSRPPSWAISVDGKTIEMRVLRRLASDGLLVLAGNRVFRVTTNSGDDPHLYSVELNGRVLEVTLEEETQSLRTDRTKSEGPVLVRSPMAGKIISLKAQVGARVEAGQALIVLEAMKMENEIAAPHNGTIKEIYVKQGALTKPGEKLILIE